MRRVLFLFLFGVGCSSFATTPAEPSTDASSSADAATTSDATPDSGSNAGGFCESFAGPYPGAWAEVATGTYGADFVDVGPGGSGRSFEVSVQGMGSQAALERTIVAKARIRCEHDVLVPLWDDQAYFLGVAIDASTGPFENWYSYWGHQHRALALFHSVKRLDGKVFSEFPTLPETTPNGWNHVKYDLSFGSSPSFSTTMGKAQVEIQPANAVPTNGAGLTFKIRIGIFAATGTSTAHKVNIANLCCEPD